MRVSNFTRADVTQQICSKRVDISIQSPGFEALLIQRERCKTGLESQMAEAEVDQGNPHGTGDKPGYCINKGP
jgi:hypothetical protein